MPAVDGPVVGGPAGETDERVEILADDDRPGGFVLLLDRVRQSYVDLDDPLYLDFEYVRWMAHAIALLPDGPLNVTHVGGGAGTLVRYVSAVRPGSTSIVLEPDESVTAVVRSRLPFARGTRVRIRPVDGRSGLLDLAADSADCVVLDAFAGARVPAELGTLECAQQIGRVLRPPGLLLANIGDGSGLGYTRRMAAAVANRLPFMALITDKNVLNGRRYGNVVLVAGAQDLPVDELRRALAREPFPVQCLAGAEMDRWVGDAAPFTDATARRSPAPPDDSWRVAPDWSTGE